MRVGVFTALLSQLSIDDVLKKLTALGVSTVELGTGNYPGDPHCKLSMLEKEQELKESGGPRRFHQRPELPRQSAASRCRFRQSQSGSDAQNDSPGGEARSPRGDRFLRLSR